MGSEIDNDRKPMTSLLPVPDAGWAGPRYPDRDEPLSEAPAIDNERAGAGRWLAVAWPLAILFHLAANGGHLVAFDTIGGVQAAMAVMACWLLIRPDHRLAGPSAALLATAYLVVFWLKLPVVGNHEVILGLFSAAVLVAAIVSGRRWPVVVAPAGRGILLASYGFIALSKLNDGFFDPIASCAVLFGDALGAAVGARPSGSPGLSAVIIVATAAIELAIPVLLAVRRYRTGGLVLALAFHWVLALDPVAHVWDFSATLYPLFLLFAPAPVRGGLDRLVGAMLGTSALRRGLGLAVVIGLQGLAMLGALGSRFPVWVVAYPAWLAVSGLVLAVVVIRGILRSGERAVPVGPVQPTLAADAGLLRPSESVRFATVLAAVLVGLATLNGLAPYLEIRSAAAFNMYSNLRVVDGASNHFFIGSLRGSTDPSYAEVSTVAASSPLAYYAENDLLLPVENLDRHLASTGDGAGSGPVGLRDRASSTLQRKLGFRRAVPASGNRCLRQWGPLG